MLCVHATHLDFTSFLFAAATHINGKHIRVWSMASTRSSFIHWDGGPAASLAPSSMDDAPAHIHIAFLCLDLLDRILAHVGLLICFRQWYAAGLAALCFLQQG